MIENASAAMQPTASTMLLLTPASERRAAKTKTEKKKTFILCVVVGGGWLARRDLFLDFGTHKVVGLEHSETVSLLIVVLYAVCEVAVASVARRGVVVACRVAGAYCRSQLAGGFLYVSKAYDACHHCAAQFVVHPCLAEAVGEGLSCHSENTPCDSHNLLHLLLKSGVDVGSHTLAV